MENSDLAGYYVPYKLNLTQGDKDGDRFTFTTTNTVIGPDAPAHGAIAATDPWASLYKNVEIASSSSDGGNGSLEVKLTADFNTGNTDLPEGEYYGTITAKINVT